MLKYFYRALLFFVAGLLGAEYSINEIAERTGDFAFTQPTTPILGKGGIAYWQDYGSTNADGGGELVLAFPGGEVAADRRTLAQAGDFPAGVPKDAQNGKLLVLGHSFEPAQPQGFAMHNTLTEYPGGVRLLYPFSSFPNGIPSSSNIQIGRSFYDNAGTIVFFFRHAVTNYVGNGAVSTLTNLPSVGTQRFFGLLIP